jgi:hypothetical protein
MIVRLLIVASLLAAQPHLAFAAGAPAAKGATATGRYLAFTGVTASIMRPNKSRGVLAIDASLDIPDAALRRRAESLNPRLRAAYSQSLTIYAAGLQPGRPLDPAYLSRELQRQTNSVLGQPGATFLIGSILVN